MTITGTLLRLVVVPLGFILGALAAAFVLVTLGLERTTQAIARDDIPFEDPATLFALMTEGAAILSAASVVPALLVVIIGEVARIRSLLYYMAGAGLAMAIAPALAAIASGQAAVLPQLAVWQVAASSGFFGGFIYWLVAGRTA